MNGILGILFPNSSVLQPIWDSYNWHFCIKMIISRDQKSIVYIPQYMMYHVLYITSTSVLLTNYRRRHCEEPLGFASIHALMRFLRDRMDCGVARLLTMTAVEPTYFGLHL